MAEWLPVGAMFANWPFLNSLDVHSPMGVQWYMIDSNQGILSKIVGALEHDLLLCPFVTHFVFCPWGSYLCPLSLFLIFPLHWVLCLPVFARVSSNRGHHTTSGWNSLRNAKKLAIFPTSLFCYCAVCCFSPISTLNEANSQHLLWYHGKNWKP
jgi:hypothetical protein